MESDRGSSKSPSVDQSEQMCVSCGCPIRDRYVMKVTPDLHWHITCLACSECGKQLNEKITCFVKGGKTYCKEDYFRSKGIVCRKCDQPFKESDYVMRVDSLIYHSQCFTCSICQLCLRAGDQYYLDEQRNLFCLKDYEKKATTNEYATPTINSDNNIISNNTIYNNNNNGIASPAADSEECDDDDDPDDDDDELIFTEPKQQPQHPHQHWNCSSNSVESFCCSENSLVASQGDSCKTLHHGRWPRDQTYQIVDSLPHQRHHISTGCLSNDTENNNNNKLSPLASATTTTMTANICQISSSISSPHCNSDYDNFLSPTTNDYNNFNRNNNSNNSNYYKSFPQNQNMPNYYKHHQHSNPTNHRSFYSDNNNNHNNNNRTHAKSKSDSNIKSKTSLKSDPQPHKTTRIRTVLNEKQLHMLKTCYAANPRPDALMKDQLVEMTGLNSRVIRVWFQNKRCKDKKRSIQLKQVRQCNQDKMKNMGMITIASPTIQSDHSPNIGTSSLDSDKFMGPPSMTHSSSDWSDYTSYGMARSGGRAYHSNNPSNIVDDPIYRSDGLNCNSGVGGQYQVPDQSQLIPRHQTPPIQQLLNSFGSNRVGPSERKNPYTDFSASKTKLLGNPISRNDDIAHGNSHHDSHMSQEQGSNNNNNNNNNGYSFDYDGRDMTGDS